MKKRLREKWVERVCVCVRWRSLYLLVWKRSRFAMVDSNELKIIATKCPAKDYKAKNLLSRVLPAVWCTLLFVCLLTNAFNPAKWKTEVMWQQIWYSHPYVTTHLLNSPPHGLQSLSLSLSSPFMIVREVYRNAETIQVHFDQAQIDFQALNSIASRETMFFQYLVAITLRTWS